MLIMSAVSASAQVIVLPPPGLEPVPVTAQTTGFIVQARQGTTVTETPVLPLAMWTCDQPMTPTPAPAPIENPSMVNVGDPDRPGRECRINLASWFRALPVGTGYTGWVASASALPAPNDRSAPVLGVPPFSVVTVFGPPALPINPRLGP